MPHTQREPSFHQFPADFLVAPFNVLRACRGESATCHVYDSALLGALDVPASGREDPYELLHLDLGHPASRPDWLRRWRRRQRRLQSEDVDLTLYFGVGDGTFENRTTVDLPGDSGGSDVVVGDFNEDGILDLFASYQRL